MPQFPKIGAFVLETLTTGMYTNPLDTVREFVQNAADSIFQAEGTLIPYNAGRIEIQIDPDSRKFVIRDNGIGIPNADVYSRLINIGMSEKNLSTSAGFRGIGRLAGIAYCQTLSFRTSSAGEKVISIIKIDCESLRRSILPGMQRVEELADVMARHSKATEEQSSVDCHFFEVIMEGVNEAAEGFLKWQTLENYLSQVAPVGFDAQRFMFAPKIKAWTEQHGISIPTITLVIKGPGVEREVFKPYKNYYKTQGTRGGNYNFDIKDVCFYPESATPDSPFWLWYGKTDLLGTVEDGRAAGLRLRARNISVGGPERVAELFAETAKTNSRFNAWYIGEIYILSPGVIPNARRDGFEDVGDWPQIKEKLMPFIKERVEEIRQSSQARNRPTIKIARAAQEMIKEANDRLKRGFVSPHQRNAILDRLVKQETLVKKASDLRQKSADAVELKKLGHQLEETRKALEQDNTFVAKKLRPDLGRKQRKVISEVLEVLYQALDEANYKKAEAAILSRFQIQVGTREK